MHVHGLCHYAWVCACGCVRHCKDGELVFSMSPSVQVIKQGAELRAELLDNIKVAN